MLLLVNDIIVIFIDVWKISNMFAQYHNTEVFIRRWNENEPDLKHQANQFGMQSETKE